MTPRREQLPISEELVLPLREIDISAARSGGPGGQRVNKVSTKVVLRFAPGRSEAIGELSEATRARLLRRLEPRLNGRGELVVHASSHREQRRNLEEGLERLASILRAALRKEKRRVATRPTAGSRRRRLEGKRRRGNLKRLRGRTEE